MAETPVTVVEMLEFQRAAKGLFTAEELDQLIETLAWNPVSGAVIPGTGGVRKLRWASRGKGTRGGARVIYYYRNETLP